jgi:hypothetical protein
VIEMARDRSPYGFLACALGAIALGLGVFLPWYGVGFTSQGVTYVQQTDSQLATQYGNAALRAQLDAAQSQLRDLAGRQIGSVSAHQVFTTISPLLLILAGIAILIVLLSVARNESTEFDNTGPWVALLGAIALIFVLYRMFVRPTGEAPYLNLTLRYGAWLSLIGAGSMIVGGLWPRRLGRNTPAPGRLNDAWSELSGWTPES